MWFVIFIILFLFIMIIVGIVKKSSDNMKSDNNKEQMTSEVPLVGSFYREAAPQLRALYSKPIIVNGHFSRMEETGTERFYIHLQMLEFDSIDERNIELNNIMTKLH